MSTGITTVTKPLEHPCWGLLCIYLSTGCSYSHCPRNYLLCWSQPWQSAFLLLSWHPCFTVWHCVSRKINGLRYQSHYAFLSARRSFHMPVHFTGILWLLSWLFH